jgi:hypothetical protein
MELNVLFGKNKRGLLKGFAPKRLTKQKGFRLWSIEKIMIDKKEEIAYKNQTKKP